MVKNFILYVLLFLAISGFGQNGKVSGVIYDDQTNETLIGANVSVGQGIGTITDFDGKFELELPFGEHVLKISYVGYNDLEKKVVISAKPVFLSLRLETIILSEVSIVADVARARETPIAFTNVIAAKIEEQLAGRDLPMVLNATPGVYATSQGGGDGDARITIRGFNQRNVAVMLDGIPVNDMENGQVYWSNWFGLDVVTRSMQVQRGLGASKLALPAIGGTINIITKGFDNKREGKFTQELDQNLKMRSTLGYNTGDLGKGWSMTLATSFKQGSTWVEETNTKGWFYYYKIDKKWNNHITSFSVMGAPQEHDQRSYKVPLMTHSDKMAKDLDAHLDTVYDALGAHAVKDIIPMDMGAAYNQHWGKLRRIADKWNADSTARIVNPNASEEVFNEKVNYYHKPQFSLRDSWTINEKLSLSNIAYLSLGNGGGKGVDLGATSSIKKEFIITDPNNPNYGQIDMQTQYDLNSGQHMGDFGPTIPIVSSFDPKLYQASAYQKAAVNNHFWYGLLTTANYKINPQATFSGGIDLRSYKGTHYTEVMDLLGADYMVDDDRPDFNSNPKAAIKKVGDKISFHDEGNLKWGGLFAQLEYISGKFSTFLNLTSAVTRVKKYDYYKDKESATKNFVGYTAKTGLNYNLTEDINLFCNAGYISKVREFSYLYMKYDTKFRDNIENELVKAFELGSSYASSIFSVNLNFYYTKWENKPTNPSTATIDDKSASAYIPGIDARHTGIELDFIYKMHEKVEFQGTISLGDWIWDKKVDNLEWIDNEYNVVLTQSFDARGIHVGDAAQTQFVGAVELKPIKRLSITTRGTFFDRYYAEFAPENCNDIAGNPIESWQLPSYFLFDIYANYTFNIQKYKLGIKLALLNVFDKMYISDANNNDSYSWMADSYSHASREDKYLIKNSFNGYGATVFIGQPRMLTTSLSFTF